MSETELNLKELIQFHKNKHRSFSPVFCPFIDTVVKFTMTGFQHLIWKKSTERRPYKIIKERLNSLEHVRNILSLSGTLQEYEYRHQSNGEFFGFIAILRDIKYKVVVFKNKHSQYKFVSVIPKQKTGIRDK